MKNIKAIVIIVAILLAGLALWFFTGSNSAPKVAQKKSAVEDRELIAIIEDPASSPKQKYTALISLGQQGGGLEHCKSYLEQKKDILLRQGAANCLGYMQDSEAVHALGEALTDSDLLIRRTILEALGKHSSDERREVIKSHLELPDLSETEKAAAYISLIRMNKGSEVDTEALTGLTSALDKETVSSQRNIIMQLINLLPENPEVLSLLRHKIYAAKDPAVIASGIRHLAAVKDEWIQTQFAHILKHKEPQVRQAAVKSLHLSCPKNRWDLLTQLAATEQDPEVLATILNEPLQMKGDEALAFYDKVLSSRFSGDNEAQDRIREYKAQVKTKPLTNFCR